MTDQNSHLNERHLNDPQLRSSIRMLNQIAANQRQFANDDLAAEAVAAHLRKFWARGMKQQMIEFVAAGGGSELSPIALKAIEKLKTSNAEHGSR